MQRNLIRPIILFLALFFAGMFHPSLSESGDMLKKNEILVIGSSNIQNGNLAQAKEEAITMAMKKGVEHYLLNKLDQQVIISHFQWITNEIIPIFHDAIANYHILTEKKLGLEYNALIKLRINEKIINQQLHEKNLLLKNGPHLKILFLVSELRGSELSYWWKDPELNTSMNLTELILFNVFQEKDFNPINHSLSLPDYDYYEDMREPELKDAIILKWGKIFNANLVIYGKTMIIDNEGVSLTLKIFDTNQGIQIYQAARTIKIPDGHVSEEVLIANLQKLVKLLIFDFTPILISLGASEKTDTKFLEIELIGLKSYQDLSSFMKFLRQDLENINAVIPTRIKKDRIVLNIKFKGNKNRLVNNILTNEHLPLRINFHHSERENIVLTIH